MQLKYGTYPFEDNATDIKAFSQTMLNRGGQPLSVKKRLDVSGTITASGQADCTQKMNLMISSLAVPYKDLVFYQDSGAISATGLVNAGSLSGVVITRGPEFLENTGGEYGTYRRYQFTAEAEYPLAGTANLLMFFMEKLSFSGGGPIRTVMNAVAGPMQAQTLYTQSPYQVVQAGRSEGYLKYPTVPPPLWPAALSQGPNIDQESPDRMGRLYERFAVTWEYRFISAKPLRGLPHLWV